MHRSRPTAPRSAMRSPISRTSPVSRRGRSISAPSRPRSAATAIGPASLWSTPRAARTSIRASWRACRSSRTSASKPQVVERAQAVAHTLMRERRLSRPIFRNVLRQCTRGVTAHEREVCLASGGVRPPAPGSPGCIRSCRGLSRASSWCRCRFFLRNAYTQFVVNVMAINIILAVGLNIVKGFAGQVTVGHVALMAIGAYSSAVVSTMLGFPFWLALPTAMLVTALRGRDRRHSVAAARRAPISRSRRSGSPSRSASSYPAPTSSAPRSGSRISRRPTSAAGRSAIIAPITTS